MPGKINGKAAPELPVTTVYVPDLELDAPSWEDLARAAYARAIDDDEPGTVRISAVDACARIMRYCDKLRSREAEQRADWPRIS